MGKKINPGRARLGKKIDQLVVYTSMYLLLIYLLTCLPNSMLLPVACLHTFLLPWPCLPASWFICLLHSLFNWLLASLLASFFTYLFTCSLANFPICLLAFLLTFFLDCFLACLFAYLFTCLVAYWLARLLSCMLICLTEFFLAFLTACFLDCLLT